MHCIGLFTAFIIWLMTVIFVSLFLPKSLSSLATWGPWLVGVFVFGWWIAGHFYECDNK